MWELDAVDPPSLANAAAGRSSASGPQRCAFQHSLHQFSHCGMVAPHPLQLRVPRVVSILSMREQTVQVVERLSHEPHRLQYGITTSTLGVAVSVVGRGHVRRRNASVGVLSHTNCGPVISQLASNC